MVSSNKISLAFLLVSFVVLLVVAPVKVNGECDCDTDNPDASFFHKVGCGFKSGAKKVKETVVEGYDYLKDKIKPTEKPATVDENLQIFDVDVRLDSSGKPIQLAPLPNEANNAQLPANAPLPSNEQLPVNNPLPVNDPLGNLR